MSDRQKILERIQKLLARNQGAGATEAEAQTATAFAARLMAEHNLTMAEIETHNPDKADWTESDVWEGNRLTLEAPFTVHILQRYFFVDYYFARTYAGQSIVRLFGDPENVETATWVFHQLCGTFRDLWTAYRVRTRAPRYEQRTYYQGLETGFMNRLYQERKDLEAKQPSSSNALAVIGDRLKAAFDAAHPDIKTVSTNPLRGSSHTLTAGRIDGANITLARPLASSARKAIDG